MWTFSAIAFAAEVVQVKWPTTQASPPVVLAPAAGEYLPAFRVAIQTLPEAAIVDLALSQPVLLGLSPIQAARLQPLTAARYRLMADSPLYAKRPSALPYCYSAEKPAEGLASVYVPDNAGAATPVILFLHGYGGSFLWYQHYLSEVFPGHLIICPAYGASAATMPPEYAAECLAAVARQLGFPLSTPNLVGLSAGGYGACQIYVSSPRSFARLVCLAASPPEKTVTRFLGNTLPNFLAGANESFVLSGEFQRQMARIRRTCPLLNSATVPGADHFFLLTHGEATAAYLRAWIPGSPGQSR